MEPTLLLVLVAAVATALATGLGALPLAFGRPGRQALSDGNAIAAGVMLAAAVALAREGVDISPTRALVGGLLGALGIVAIRRHLPAQPRLGGVGMVGEDARRAVTVLVVMTAHSAAEGIGIGVSFGEGATFGWAIAIAIAVHNIPEGLAISLVLVPRGVSVSRAAGWSILSSAPQPILAVPAFAFVTVFLPVLPIGLGLAAGAMAWMVLTELGPEALRGAPVWRVGVLGTVAFVAMMAFQAAIVGF